MQAETMYLPLCFRSCLQHKGFDTLVTQPLFDLVCPVLRMEMHQLNYAPFLLPKRCMHANRNDSHTPTCVREHGVTTMTRFTAGFPEGPCRSSVQMRLITCRVFLHHDMSP